MRPAGRMRIQRKGRLKKSASPGLHLVQVVPCAVVVGTNPEHALQQRKPFLQTVLWIPLPQGAGQIAGVAGLLLFVGR